MKEQLQPKLVEILTSIQTAAGKASDFALEQLPDIAQSYVLYGRIKTIYESAILVLFAIALFAFSRWAHKNPWNTSVYSWDKDRARSDSNYLAMMVPAGIGIFLLVSAVMSFNWLVWLAPKVWLLKEIAALLK